jgi:hypothetical protein
MSRSQTVIMDEKIVQEFLDDLRKELKAKHVVVLIGAGVSVGATNQNRLASWTGLLLDGGERSESLDLLHKLPRNWGERVRDGIQSGDMDDLLGAAELISTKLKGQPGEFGRWLRETVGELNPENPLSLDALLSLGAPILTTNYDALIEKASDWKRQPFTWRQPAELQRILRGDELGIGHIHGYWQDPDSVILGIRSYQQLLGSEEAQAHLHAALATKMFLFVGCGAGLEDPNFSALLNWAGGALRSSQYRHYRLCKTDEIDKVDYPDFHIRALPYGESHRDLPSFLESLIPQAPRPIIVDTAQESVRSLTGARTIQVWISQLFRIADLLILPTTVRAQKFLEIIHDPNKLRRALNKRTRIKLGALGFIKPVVSISDPFESFWSAAIPDLRAPTIRRLWFLPFELSLSEYLSARRSDSSSDLGNVLEQADSLLANRQIGGRLRIYPPGVGVVRVGITLTFKTSVQVQTVARIVREIEQLMFVNPQGQQQPFEDVLLEIVNQVDEALFLSDKGFRTERRWRPPEIVYSLHDDGAFRPEENIQGLSELLSLAPRNNQARSELEGRLAKAVNSPHWQKDLTLAAVAEGVAFLFVNSSHSDNRTKRDKLLHSLAETSEVIAAGAYSEKALLERVQEISEPRELNDSWLPERSDKFEFLGRLLQTFKMVLQAIASTKLDLQKRGSGVLMSFATDIWFHNNPVSPEELQISIAYVKEWLASAQARNSDVRLEELLRCAEEIGALSAPFRAKSR